MPRSVLQRVHCSLDTIADTTYRMVWNGLVHPPVLLGKYRGIDRLYQGECSSDGCSYGCPRLLTTSTSPPHRSY